MRLVDRHERRPSSGQPLHEPSRFETLRGDVDELVAPFGNRLLACPELFRIERRSEIGGFDPALRERADLVFHQRDERRDDDGGAAKDRGRQLVAKRLAAPGRRDDDDLLSASEQLFDRFPLPRPKRGKPKPLPQRYIDVAHPRFHARLIGHPRPQLRLRSTCPCPNTEWSRARADLD